MKCANVSEHRHLRRRGVSIVELLIVVVILLIFSTLTTISYHNMTRGLVARSQANEINAAFVLARQLAITNSVSHQVTIDRELRQFWIDRVNSAGEVILPKVSGTEPFLEQTRVGSITVGSAVVDPHTRAEILFRPDGSSQRAVIQITQQGADLSDDSEYFTIVLYPATASTRIYSNERR
jgi:prepilin-type N-terminal cleavage/methylation domain-containing protein